jgi:hypothetical protein
MNIRPAATIAAIAALLATQSCKRSTAWPPEPDRIHFGEDACAACSMIIGDATYAAQIRSPNGATQVFDDIGCMLTKATASTDPAGIFVRAFDGTGWIRGDRAFVVHAKDIASPMGYGFVAFALQSDADAAAKSHPGSVVAELRSLFGSPSRLPTHLRGAGLPELSSKGELRE